MALPQDASKYWYPLYSSNIEYLTMSMSVLSAEGLLDLYLKFMVHSTGSYCNMFSLQQQGALLRLEKGCPSRMCWLLPGLEHSALKTRQICSEHFNQPAVNRTERALESDWSSVPL